MIGGTSSVRRYVVQGRSPESSSPFPTARKNLLVPWAAFFPIRSLSVLEVVTSSSRVLPAATASPVADFVVVSPIRSLSVLEAATFPGRVLLAAAASPVADVVVVSGGDSGAITPLSKVALSSAAAPFAGRARFRRGERLFQSRGRGPRHILIESIPATL